MRLKSMSDDAICLALGERVKALRLKANITQEAVSKRTGISRQTIVNLESHGRGTIATLVAVLRAIDALDRLSSLVESVRPSPLKVAEMHGRPRKRASTIAAPRIAAGRPGAQPIGPVLVRKDPKGTKGADW